PNDRANVGIRHPGRPTDRPEAGRSEHETRGGGAGEGAVAAARWCANGCEAHRRRGRASAQSRRRVSSGPVVPGRSLRAAWYSGRLALGPARTRFAACDLIDPRTIELLRTELQLEALAYHACQKA